MSLCVCVCEGEGEEERELIALHVLLRYHKSKLTHIRQKGAVKHIWICEDDIGLIACINAVIAACVSVTRHRPHR